MDDFRRYGIFAVPEGAFFDLASAWLGWDSVAGRCVPHPVIEHIPAPIEALTAAPRKYGFHGTLKAPFRLAEGRKAADLSRAVGAFCAARAPVTVPEMQVHRLGGFVAVVPAVRAAALADLAAQVVSVLDPFRAPLSEAELARRRKAGLSDRQEALLQRWGYPFVMEEFRFHLTLTGRMPHADTVREALARHFAPVLPRPFVIDTLALMGEAADGRFHLIQRYGLSG
ncbi:phosphonate metabolism protein [Jannaschia sp. EhC01]|nr:phosphonate metabolism protein [Jannaschia sp. EhC01]